MISFALLCSLTPLAGPTMLGSGAEKLAPSLRTRLETARPTEFLPVDIVLEAQVAPQVIADAGKLPTKALRRAAVVSLLRANQSASQPGLLAYLEDLKTEGKVEGPIKQLWIANVVSVHATAEAIQELAERSDVGSLHYDPPRGAEVLSSLPAQGAPGAPTCGLNLVGAPNTWSQVGVTGKGVVVGLIDTGLCATHPDIAGQRWCNPGEIASNGIDDDSNGFIDDVFGWNFESGNNNTTDTFGHGSHTGGTIAGDGTNGTQCGVAPDARIMTLKFWNSFSGEQSVWDCMQYGVANGADILSASLGWPHFFNPNRAVWRQVCDNAIAAGLIVVYAAGNEGCGAGIDNVRTPGDVPGVITVGAVDCASNLAGFSSCGPVSWTGVAPYNDWPFPPGLTKPDIAAPGVSTTSHNLCAGYTNLDGTSMATPHIAGIAALLLEANPTLDQVGIKTILEGTAQDLGTPGKDNQFGAGLVRAGQAVAQAVGAGNFCAPKLNSCGTLPAITMNGFPKASSSSGFTVSATNLAAGEFGLLVYGDQGPANLPFFGGALCVNGPSRALAMVDTTGTPGQCNGVLSIDMNSFAAGLLGGSPLPSLAIPGTTIHCQYWDRDPANSFGVVLSGAFKYTVCP